MLAQPEAQAARYRYAAAGPAREVDRGLVLGLDGDLLFPIANAPSGVANAKEPFSTGFGIDGRLGYRASNRILFVQPELDLGLQRMTFNGSNALATGVKAAPDDTMGRFMVGARAGFRGIVEPQIIGHLGYAAGHFGGFTYDIGAALDGHIGRITFGAHVTFNQVLSSAETSRVGTVTVTQVNPSVKWLDIGPHFGVIF